MEDQDHRAGNPFTELEGYAVLDASGAEVGRIESTVYDAVSDVLKYVVLNGRPIPAESLDVDAQAEQATVPYKESTVESAPGMQDPSGAFDDAVREHYARGG